MVALTLCVLRQASGILFKASEKFSLKTPLTYTQVCLWCQLKTTHCPAVVYTHFFAKSSSGFAHICQLRTPCANQGLRTPFSLRGLNILNLHHLNAQSCNVSFLERSRDINQFFLK